MTPLLGFSWGFHIADDGNVTLDPIASLTAADWELHLPYLKEYYPGWSITGMSMSPD